MLLNADGSLVVDQPDDHLDNRFISADIAPRLRAATRERRFVLSTHDANIPVPGDAELILELTAAGETGFSTASETRRRKYGC